MPITMMLTMKIPNYWIDFEYRNRKKLFLRTRPLHQQLQNGIWK